MTDQQAPSDSIYEEGGEQTNIYDRWQQKRLEVKKYVDDVSGVEKLHASHLYFSKVLNGVEN